MNNDIHFENHTNQQHTKLPLDPFEIEIDFFPKINFAFQQNEIPFIQEIKIHNQSEQTFENITIHVWGEPGLPHQWDFNIDSIVAHSTNNLKNVRMDFSPQYLFDLTERETGLIHIDVKQGNNVLHSESQKFEALAYNEWCGIDELPEIIAAFVLPNQAAIEDIIQLAKDRLRETTGDASLSGYQTRDIARVIHTVKALYDTLCSLDISYITPPASFEKTGQKIRFPNAIFRSRMGTCLDLTVLSAACLEQMGLYPFIVLIEGHAFLGVWLVEETYPYSCISDPITFRKYADVKTILLCDITGITSSPKYSFEHACQKGRDYLNDENTFRYAIDVKAARNRGLRPISIRKRSIDTDSESNEFDIHSVWKESEKHTEKKNQTKEIDIEVEELVPITEKEDVPARIERWKRQLLDLSLRNRLLNFKETRKTCTLLCHNLSRLEDALADGKAFQILSKEGLPFQNDKRNPEQYKEDTGNDPIENFLHEEMKKHRLYADLTASELDKNLVEIYRESRYSLEEGGANTLYLALGFLNWYESSSSERKLEAPIILIPLQISRPSIQKGIEISMLEEEARFNVTLQQKLKEFGIEINDLDPLPTDQSGIDLDEIFERIKFAVLNESRFEVNDKKASIAHFSFTKFLLWNELENHLAKIKNNPIVSHLIERSTTPYHDGVQFPDINELDDKYPPQNIFCPLDSDASQLASIIAAADGKTFVLQGPPGTGKSQTITNIITHCLALGKRVLFVSAKMAALNVVHDRLSKIGLKPHCLELHSNKTDKKSVLGQMNESFAVEPINKPDKWEHESKRLHVLRSELNRYASLLRHKQTFGKTTFEMISKLCAYHKTPWVKLTWDKPLEVSNEKLSDIYDILDRYISAAQSVSPIHHHPWKACQLAEWKPAVETQALSLMKEIQSISLRIHKHLDECSSTLKFNPHELTASELNAIVKFARLLLERTIPNRVLLERTTWDTTKSRIQSWLETGQKRDKGRNLIFSHFKETILTQDLDEIHENLKQMLSSSPPMSWWYWFKSYRALKRLAKQKLPASKQWIEFIETAQTVNQCNRELEHDQHEATQCLGELWHGGEANWETVQQHLHWVDRFRKLWSFIPAQDFDERKQIKDRWIQLATDMRDHVKPDSALGKTLAQLAADYNAFESKRHELNECLHLNENLFWGDPEEKQYLSRIQPTIQKCLDNQNVFSRWCGYVERCQKMKEVELDNLVQRFEEENLPIEKMVPVFEHSFYRHCWNHILDMHPEFSQFQSYEQNRKIKRFSETDRQYLGLAQQQVQSQLSQDIPNLEHATDNSGTGIIRREIKKKRMHKPIRKLLQEVGPTIFKIKPCFLMSPLSVVQYLDLELEPFDMVIFDEASQIPVWDAVCTLARGKQAVVVGDSKQLPPTNFFEKAIDMDDTDEGNEDDIQDMESILDEFEASNFPNYRLRWHYRSRHEHLIAFSNYQYYDNHLITFPSAQEKHPHLGVDLIHLPDAIYDRSKTRTNQMEAEVIVEKIIEQLNDPERCHKSIGIVTMNQAQQTLIEDLLDKARRDNPDIERFFNSGNDDQSVPEAIIVKNLENVQGDERDIIFLSITYGPDSHGKISMHFGPMNRDGGERRLNVAITRAREKVYLVSSLLAEQIDTSKTRSRGIRDLKTYLEYAQKGPKAIAEALILSETHDFESPLEKEIYSELAARGWNADTQIGCSGYRIDIAVKHPQEPGRYVLGIECDGAFYHSSRVARERDRLRETVLSSLGWNIHRVWSTDWWRDRASEMKKIEDKLNHLLKPSSTSKPIVIKKTKPPASDQPQEPEPQQLYAHQSASPQAQPTGDRPPNAEYFEPFDPQAYVIHAKANKFYEKSSNKLISDLIVKIVETEGPIVFERLARLITRVWGINRMGNRVQERIKQRIPKRSIRYFEDRGRWFCCLKKVSIEELNGYRIPKCDNDKRKFEEIPTQEIQNAAISILTQQVQIPKQDLILEIAKTFGYQRAGTSSKNEIETCLQLLIEDGKIIDYESQYLSP